MNYSIVSSQLTEQMNVMATVIYRIELELKINMEIHSKMSTSIMTVTPGLKF